MIKDIIIIDFIYNFPPFTSYFPILFPIIVHAALYIPLATIYWILSKFISIIIVAYSRTPIRPLTNVIDSKAIQSIAIAIIFGNPILQYSYSPSYTLLGEAENYSYISFENEKYINILIKIKESKFVINPASAIPSICILYLTRNI